VKKIVVLGIFTSFVMMGMAKPASAQVIPNVRGLQPFTAATSFMSLPGYARWQYFMENDVWISRAEAAALVNAQIQGTTPGG